MFLEAQDVEITTEALQRSLDAMALVLKARNEREIIYRYTYTA